MLKKEKGDMTPHMGVGCMVACWEANGLTGCEGDFETTRALDARELRDFTE